MVFVKTLFRQAGKIYHDMSEFNEAVAAAEPSESGPSRDIEDYLVSWGLAMYIDKFKEQSIDVETLQILSAEDLKELVPIIGHRAKLTSQILMLKNIVSDAFPVTNTADELIDTNNTLYHVNDDTLVLFDYGEQVEEQTARSPEKEIDKNCELYQLLSSCNEGKGLLLQYQEHGLLDNASRRRLCNLIINNELKDDPEKSIKS